MRKKQVDVIGRIINSIEQISHFYGVENGKVHVPIKYLVCNVYNTKKPTESQFKSVYRAVNYLEKKGILSSEKISAPEYSIGGKRYLKKIYANVNNWKVYTNDVKN